MTKLNKQIKIWSLVAIALIIVVITFGLIHLGVNWSQKGLVDSLTTGLREYAEAFNFNNWALMTDPYLILSTTLTIALTLIGVVIFVAWLVLAIIRPERKFGIVGAFVFLLSTMLLLFFIPNTIKVYDAALVAGEALAYLFLITLVLNVFAVTVLFILSMRHLFLPVKNYTEETVIERTIVLEEIDETVVEINNTNTTIIINDVKQDEVLNEAKSDSTVIVSSAFGSGKKKPRPPFALRLRRGEDHIRDMYNELKAEFLSYGLNSRISLNGDTFRLHTKTYAIIQVVGKSLKINFALDCKNYENSTIPFTDSGKQKKYEEVPFTFKTRSNLSIKRAKELIRDAVTKDGITQEHEPVQRNHARETIETLKTSQYYLKNFARK